MPNCTYRNHACPIKKMSTVVVPCQFFPANMAEEEVARFVVGHDSGMCKAGSLQRAFGSQRHYRSLSRVDEETTAHKEWVRLNCQGENRCRLFHCLGRQDFSHWQCTQHEHLCANKETLFALVSVHLFLPRMGSSSVALFFVCVTLQGRRCVCLCF